MLHIARTFLRPVAFAGRVRSWLLDEDADPSVRPALDRLEAKRNRDATWNLDALHPDFEDPQYRTRGPSYSLGLEVPGRPSRWITTTALTVSPTSGPLMGVRAKGETMPRAGLEPATSRSSVSHSPKLSYRGARRANARREK